MMFFLFVNSRDFGKSSWRMWFLACCVLFVTFILNPVATLSDAGGTSELSQEEKDELEALGYVTWNPTENELESGVTLFDKKRTCKGINIYNSRDLS